jgi:hypothetical protein
VRANAIGMSSYKALDTAVLFYTFTGILYYICTLFMLTISRRIIRRAWRPLLVLFAVLFWAQFLSAIGLPALDDYPYKLTNTTVCCLFV